MSIEGPKLASSVFSGFWAVIFLGRCFRSVDSSSDGSPKFIAMDEEAQPQSVHRSRFGETHRATHEPLDPGAHTDVLACDLLRMRFAHRVLRGITMALVGSPACGVKPRDAKRC